MPILPDEPTTEMLEAGIRAHTGARGEGYYFDTKAIYRAMIAAAPPVTEEHVEAVARAIWDAFREDAIGGDYDALHETTWDEMYAFADVTADSLSSEAVTLVLSKAHAAIKALGGPEGPAGSATENKGMADTAIAAGSYVLATKYADGDPGDPWAVGYYIGAAPHGRHLIGDRGGNLYRGPTGYRRVRAGLRADVGAWLMANAGILVEAPSGTINLWTMLTDLAFDDGATTEPDKP